MKHFVRHTKLTSYVISKADGTQGDEAEVKSFHELPILQVTKHQGGQQEQKQCTREYHNTGVKHSVNDNTTLISSI